VSERLRKGAKGSGRLDQAERRRRAGTRTTSDVRPTAPLAAAALLSHLTRDDDHALALRRLVAEPLLALQASHGNAFTACTMAGVQRQAAPAAAAVEREVPGLSEETAQEANKLIQEHKRQEAIDVIVTDLASSGQMDLSLLRKRRVEFSATISGEGLTTVLGYKKDPVTKARIARLHRIQIGREAFGKGIPWLYSSILHEYQHVVQGQPGSTSLVPGGVVQEGRLRQQEVEAYASEILDARQTGIAKRPKQLRETWRRLHDYWSRLGVPGKRPLNDLYKRAHTEAETLLGKPLPHFTPLP